MEMMTNCIGGLNTLLRLIVKYMSVRQPYRHCLLLNHVLGTAVMHYVDNEELCANLSEEEIVTVISLL